MGEFEVAIRVTDEAYGLGSMFIIDPLYTLPLIAVIVTSPTTLGPNAYIPIFNWDASATVSVKPPDTAVVGPGPAGITEKVFLEKL